MSRANSSKIKAVILDYGEVLCYPPTAEEWGRMSGLLGVDPAQFRNLWDKRRLEYDRGDLSPEAYWASVAKDAGTELAPGNLDSLLPWDREMWAHDNPVMVEWLRQIHSSGIRTGLLSNMPHDMIQHVRRKFAWFKYFDHLTFSAEINEIKPDPAIYQHSLQGVGVVAFETLFVDDKERNVAGAREVGMNGIHFRSVEQFAQDLDKLGFPILPVDSKGPGRSS